jgi:cysteine desulfurase
MLYLDFAATSACHPQVWEAMTPYALTDFGNPASLHEAGQSAKTALEQARTTLLHLLGVSEQSHCSLQAVRKAIISSFKACFGVG